MTTVGERFRELLAAVAPRAAEVQRARDRLVRMSRRINGDFDVRKLWIVGSHWKGTAVRRFSDFDLFVVMTRGEVAKWSSNLRSTTILARVRNSLFRSYPSVRLRVDRQAVVVAFERGAHAIDVVPAVFESFQVQARSPVYAIPDGNGSWLQTAPEIQKAYLDEADLRSGHKLKGLVRLLKWWGASRTTTSSLSSLYIEHFVAAHNIQIGPTYQEALAETLDTIARSKCPPLNDPLGLSARPFAAAKTPAQHRALVNTATTCADRARRALEREYRGHTREAIWTWSLVFNHMFPRVS